MISIEGKMGLVGGMVESERDCLHISGKENQTTGVALRKNGVNHP